MLLNPKNALDAHIVSQEHPSIKGLWKRVRSIDLSNPIPLTFTQPQIELSDAFTPADLLGRR